jgi:Phage tail assembly chaperone protein, TAC
MTPREMAMAMKAFAGRRQPLARNDLEQLLQQFPDGI